MSACVIQRHAVDEIGQAIGKAPCRICDVTIGGLPGRV